MVQRALIRLPKNGLRVLSKRDHVHLTHTEVGPKRMKVHGTAFLEPRSLRRARIPPWRSALPSPAEVTVDRDELIAPVMRRVRELCSGVAPSQVTARTLIECCRQILRLKADWMSALDVRQALHAARFDFSEYKSNPLSSIHTTLKRIAESGQAWSRESSGENLYRWKTSGENAPLQPESSPETPVSAAREEPTK
jgi:hypothetical protein